MLWIRFDESDHRTPAPHFCLPKIGGGDGDQICLGDYLEDCNLALFFTHGTGCAGCMKALQSFALRLGDYQDLDARVLAIIPETAVEAAGIAAQPSLPFPLLSDPKSAARHSYAGLVAEGLVPEGASLLFVLDRYHAPYAALANREDEEGVEIFAREDVQDDILKWFEYISVQCPE